ncbi:MAG: imidazoleglycerol-phosphate dehydratase HisB [Ruminococcaceae bacterium]|nr:imidazoleglycerol-phosphate dehydratase HisB [Oscillospiraceae bacterium]
MRTAVIKRETLETRITAELCLEGGETEISTGIGFFDHMLNSFAKHSGFGLRLHCEGDLNVDGHHTVEDVGIVLGMALKEAVGERKGIARYGSFTVPMDEALCSAHVDVSGRPFLCFNAHYPQAMCGDYDCSLTVEFFRAFAVNGGLTLHLSEQYGDNSHHIIEALFKACAHALRIACAVTREDTLSTKGVL